jgi:16S rRNA (adenine1518-N6/adenine1519-N6)-dimethyltransferase
MRAKKSFGQHFLTNEDIARRIAGALAFAGQIPRVLEVGPGKGMLTKYLLEKEVDLKAVEADQDMVDWLNAHYPVLRDRLIHRDFLRLDLSTVFPGDTLPAPQDGTASPHKEFLLIGNFPYNISSQIVFRMLEYRQWIPEMVGMFQKEMAMRIIAPPGGKDYGIISVLSQAYYRAEYLFTVGNQNFNPPPKVQSAVIRLTRREQEPDCDESLLRKVVKQAFSQRRKMLRNTLKPFFKDPAVLEEPYFTQRPEVLSVEDFVALTRRIAEAGAGHSSSSSSDLPK